MAIESPCPGCGVVLAVPDETAGKQARCPECSATFVVPQKSHVSRSKPADTAAATPQDASQDEARNAALASAEAALEPEIPVAIAAPPDRRQWWLKTPQGAVYGPISKEQLDIWCEEGRVADDCQLKHEEELAWRDAILEYPQISHEEPPPTPSQTPFIPTLEPSAPVRPTVILPHRGVIVIALGAASWITVVCPVFGVVAWNMGNRDLELMYAGQMDASGMRMTHLGRMLGLIHVLAFVTLLILGLGFAVIFLVMQ
jgi:hypothetical protein